MCGWGCLCACVRVCVRLWVCVWVSVFVGVWVFRCGIPSVCPSICPSVLVVLWMLLGPTRLLPVGLQQEQQAVEGDQEAPWLLLEEQDDVRLLPRLREDVAETVKTQLTGQIPETQDLQEDKGQQRTSRAEGWTGCPPEMHTHTHTPCLWSS